VTEEVRRREATGFRVGDQIRYDYRHFRERAYVLQVDEAGDRLKVRTAQLRAQAPITMWIPTSAVIRQEP
jgi:hypothetical protein